MKRGFTLIEVLISIVIMSIVIGGLFIVLNIADLNWSLGGGLLGLQQQARQAMDGMTREIRQLKREKDRSLTIRDAGGSSSTSGPEIEFYIPPFDNPIRYFLRWYPPPESSWSIIRQHNGTEQRLANNIAVAGLNFVCVNGANCTDAPIVQINIRVTKNIRGRDLCFPSPCNPPQSLAEEVKIRN